MADQIDPAVVAQISDQIRRSMGGALVQIGADLQKLDRVSKDVTGPSGGLGRLDSTFIGMSTRLLGPVGLVAGLYQVSNALSRVAAESVQMQAFSRNTGLAVDNIKDFQLQMQMMGKSSEEAKAAIGSINGILNNFNTYKEQSNLSQTMFGREGGAAFLNRLNAAKDRMGQINEILETYRKGDERQKRGLADVFTNGDVDALDRLVLKSDLLSKTFQANEQDLRKYHEASVLFEANVSEAWKAVSGNAISALNDITGGAQGGARAFKTIVEAINNDTDEFADKLRGTVEEIRQLYAIYNDIKSGNFSEAGTRTKNFLGIGGRPGGSDGMDPGPSPHSYDPNAMDAESNGGGGSGFSGSSRFYIRGKLPVFDLRKRRGGEINDSSGSDKLGGGRGADELLNTEKDSSRTLLDIRDSLLRMENGSGSGGSGGDGETWGGGGRGRLGARNGMYNPEGIPGMPGSPRGKTPGVGTERGRVGAGEDPRGMESYIREAAKARGIDPDTAVAVAKSEGLASFQSTVRSGKGPNGREDSWGAFQLYKGGGLGNEFQKKTGLDPADPSNEKATIDFALDHAAKKGWGAFHGAKNTGIDRFAGIGANSPGRPAYSGGNGDGLPSAVLEEAKRVAASDGPGAVQSYIRSQGYNVNSAWCGDFAAAVVSASGGTPPEGHSIASNWRKFGKQVDDPQPGDIAVRKSSRFGGGYTPTGQTGSHVTIFEGADGKGRFTGIGGNQSGRRSSFPLSGYEYFRGGAEEQAARDRMDQTSKSVWDGTMRATVDFKNVPPGVATYAETSGSPFEELRINKTRQNDVSGGNTGTPFSGVW